MNVRLLLALALSIPLSSACLQDDPCIDSPQPGGAIDPGPLLRNPENGSCQSFGGSGGGGGGSTCGDYDVRPQDSAEQRPISPDWGECFSICETLTESDCLVAEECRGIYVSSCPSGSGTGDEFCQPSDPTFDQCWALSTAGPIEQTECSLYGADECARHNECSAVHIPNGDNSAGNFFNCIDEPGDPTDPGTCIGMIACDGLPPACPIDTVPGIIDAEGCWSGYCIPVEDCGQLPACELQAEASCVTRADCEPLYVGVDCICDADGCTCADWLFDTCETGE